MRFNSVSVVSLTGCLKMRVRKMRVYCKVRVLWWVWKRRVRNMRVRLTGLENANIDYASTENVSTKVLSQDKTNTENAGSVHTMRLRLRGMEYASAEYASTQ
jgi:hypothetical protein